ncbi:hypothetical protein ACOME3_002760 [Neoechinorhynchus agilis]
MVSRYRELVEASIYKLRTDYMRPRASKTAEELLDCDYVLAESEYINHEVNDSFMPSLVKFVTRVRNDIEYAGVALSERILERVTTMLAAELAKSLERYIHVCSFNHCGGLLLDRQIRSAVAYIQSSSPHGFGAREQFRRLLKITNVLSSETLMECQTLLSEQDEFALKGESEARIRDFRLNRQMKTMVVVQLAFVICQSLPMIPLTEHTTEPFQERVITFEVLKESLFDPSMNVFNTLSKNEIDDRKGFLEAVIYMRDSTRPCKIMTINNGDPVYEIDSLLSATYSKIEDDSAKKTIVDFTLWTIRHSTQLSGNYLESIGLSFKRKCSGLSSVTKRSSNLTIAWYRSRELN